VSRASSPVRRFSRRVISGADRVCGEVAIRHSHLARSIRRPPACHLARQDTDSQAGRVRMRDAPAVGGSRLWPKAGFDTIRGCGRERSLEVYRALDLAGGRSTSPTAARPSTHRRRTARALANEQERHRSTTPSSGTRSGGSSRTGSRASAESRPRPAIECPRTPAASRAHDVPDILTSTRSPNSAESQVADALEARGACADRRLGRSVRTRSP